MRTDPPIGNARRSHKTTTEAAIRFRPRIAQALRGLFRRGGNRRAVAAVEFALAAPPLLLLAFGSISLNLAIYCMAAMQNGAQYAAMSVASGLVTSNAAGTFATQSSAGPTACSSKSVTSSTAEYYACQGLPSWTTFSVSMTESCAVAVPTITVKITANASAAALEDIYTLLTGKTLTVQTVAMMQGQCP